MTKLAAGQVAVVTGGATGIGFALAEAFVRKGLRVALADVDAAALRDAVTRLTGRGGIVMGLTADVADAGAVRRLREQVDGAFGAVDVICNNAGIYNRVEPVWAIDPAQWR